MGKWDNLRRIQTPEGMAAAALRRDQRRGGHDHRFLAGRFVFEFDERVLLEAIEMGPAWDIVRPVRFTSCARLWYRWRTRQAAQQFIDRWSIRDVRTLDLDFLDVLPAAHGKAPDRSGAVAASGLERWGDHVG